VLFAGYLLLGLTLALTAVAMLREMQPLLVYALAITASLALTLIRPSQGALLPSLARTPAELTAANAVSGIVEAGGLLVAPPVVAGILAVSSPGAVLAALAALVVVTDLLVMGVSPPVPAAARSARAGAARGTSAPTGPRSAHSPRRPRPPRDAGPTRRR